MWRWLKLVFTRARNRDLNRKAVASFHRAIIVRATEKLGRELTPAERVFVIRREGFIALETILDTVNGAADGGEVERYLNSENLP